MGDSARTRAAGEAGFTIVEVMVGVVMLVVGVLAMLVMIEGSLASTSRTTAREQATNLARDLVERARQVPYATTKTTTAPTALAARLPENPAVTGSSFVVQRRGVSYTATISSCSIDDPADGAGVGDTTFCEALSGSTGPGDPTTVGLAVGPNILGLPVTIAAGGSLVTTLCNAIGTNTAIANEVSSLATSLVGAEGQGATISLCGSTAGSAAVAFDAIPDDLRRVRVALSWTPHGASTPSTLTQTTLVTSPA